MEITKDDFERYEEVRKSSRTNMFAVSNVCDLSGLEPEKVREIMKQYSLLSKKYPEVIKSK